MNLLHVADSSSTDFSSRFRDASVRTPTILNLNSLLPDTSAETFSLDTSQAALAEVHVESERLSPSSSVHVINNLVSPCAAVANAQSVSNGIVVDASASCVSTEEEISQPGLQGAKENSQPGLQVAKEIEKSDTCMFESPGRFKDGDHNLAPGAITTNSTDISVLHMNIRGWRSHCNELEAYLQVLDAKPKIVAITETFLNRSCNAELFGYKLVGRRDRPSASDCFTDFFQSWGGVLVFVSKDYDGSIVELHTSDCAE